MSYAKKADEIPQEKGEDWVQWLEKQSPIYLSGLIIDQHLEIEHLKSLVEHLRKYQMAAAKEHWRDQFIEAQLMPDYDGSTLSDSEIAKKAGVSPRVVREIRNKLGNKKPRGRPKKPKNNTE